MKWVVRKQRSIKWKIFSSLLFFVLIIITGLWLFQVYFLAEFYEYIKSNSVRHAAKEVNEMITRRFHEDISEEHYVDGMDSIAEENGFCVIVFDLKEPTNPLRSFSTSPRCKEELFEYEEFRNVIDELKLKAEENGGIASKLFTYNDIKEKLLFNDTNTLQKDITKSSLIENKKTVKRSGNMQGMTYVSVVIYKGKVKSSVINAQLTPVNATIEAIKVQFIIITAILIGIASSLAFYLSKKIAKPIIAMNMEAKRLATGTYDVAFQGKGYLEIEELSNTLNHTAKELSKVESFREELLANMSHDLRTPLTMISGYGEVIRDIPGENKPENVQIIIDEAKRLTNLVNDMLDLGKLQAGVQELHITTFNITEEIRNIIQRYDKLLSVKEYDFIFKYTDDVMVQGDVIKIHQVMYNLINNAINYCGEDHQVMIHQDITQDSVYFSVCDHGSGISQDQLPYIWERYYKIDKTHTRTKVGSGLGLSIVKVILELHKVKYGVISKLDEGTTFWFQLDMYKE